jgi:hypothetical protein
MDYTILNAWKEEGRSINEDVIIPAKNCDFDKGYFNTKTLFGIVRMSLIRS